VERFRIEPEVFGDRLRIPLALDVYAIEIALLVGE
jgi:hypothetical protein